MSARLEDPRGGGVTKIAMRGILQPQVRALLGPACCPIPGACLLSGGVVPRRAVRLSRRRPLLLPALPPRSAGMGAHRWPLWDPGQNGGMPLLGMPMAAVLYPGKVLHAVFAYPWAVRLYTVVHVVVAWAGMFVLARHLAAVDHRGGPRRDGLCVWRTGAVPVLQHHLPRRRRVGPLGLPRAGACCSAGSGARHCWAWRWSWPFRCSGAIPRRLI